jgi:hypothetical protein
MHSRLSLAAGLVLLFSSTAMLCAAEGRAGAKPVLLYSRYFNAAGESRYLPEGTYREVLGKLREEFEVRVSSEALTEESLVGVRVVWIANPSERAVGTNPPPPHVSARDVDSLTRYVRRGGGLIVMGNQENHNLETQDLNVLLARCGLRFTNEYTDVKAISIGRETPVIGGLRWAYYTGNSIALESGHTARPRCLVANDTEQQPLNGARNAPGCLLAAAEPGQGRVVLVTDAGWLTDDALSGKGIGGVGIKEQDNWEIFRRLAHWSAHSSGKTPGQR